MRIQTKLNKKSSFFDWRGILLGWIGKEGNKISLSFNNKMLTARMFIIFIMFTTCVSNLINRKNAVD